MRLEIESHLYQRLPALYPYRQNQNGYRIFEVPDLPGGKRIRLPDFTGRHDAIEWLLQQLGLAESAEARAVLQGAREEQRRLSDLYQSDLPPILRGQLLTRIRAQEAEIERLEGELPKLGSQLMDAIT
jgi:hypothetical protein